MIRYDRLWQTMKKKGITQYTLYTTYNINRSQLNRLRHNENVQVNTIDKLCNILHCRVEDIMEHFDDNNMQKTRKVVFLWVLIFMIWVFGYKHGLGVACFTG